MSRHDGVSCDACLKANFYGRRYKCLICYDYDLCSGCYEGGSTTTRHTTEHPMQCILTRHHFEIFYGGEALNVDQPQSLTCPFCGKMGYTEQSLQEHVAADHSDTNYEVVCPICASVPGGEPNHVTDDFASHLTLEHRSSVTRDPREEEPSSSRPGVHRVPHRGRGVGRAVAHRNMTFGNVNSGSFAPFSRDSMDPIAELLSQLSGVRRPTATDLPSSTSSNLSPHVHRQQPTTRQHQQLDRLPRRGGSTNSSGSATSSSVANGNLVGSGSSSLGTGLTNGSAFGGQGSAVISSGSKIPSLVSPHHPPPILVHSTSRHQSQYQFLLSRLGDGEGSQEGTAESKDRASFVHELLLSTLTDLNLSDMRPSVAAAPGQPTTPRLVETSSDAATQTNPVPAPVSANPPANNVPVPTQAPPVVPPPSKISPPLKSSRGNTKVAPGRSTGQPANGGQSNGVGMGRTVTGTGTVSVSPVVGVGRASGGPSVSPGSGRRKMVRGTEGRATQPPPPH